MSEGTKIAWADDTVNFWHGCQKIATGCAHCYAETMSNRFNKTKLWGAGSSRLYQPNAIKTLERLNRKAEREGKPRLCFVNSMSDFFEDFDGPVVAANDVQVWKRHDGSYTTSDHYPDTVALTIADLRRDAFAAFDRLPWLRFLLLTKRLENVRKMWEHGGSPRPGMPGGYRPNVWLGASISTQADADRIEPELRKCRDLVPVLFLSCEPLLEEIDLTCIPCGGEPTKEGHEPVSYNTLGKEILTNWNYGYPGKAGIDWVLIGGESGKGARPCHLDWIRSLVRQCREAGTKCFVKQCGSHAIDTEYTNTASTVRGQVVGVRFRDSKGGDPDGWAEDFRVRQFPEATS